MAAVENDDINVLLDHLMGWRGDSWRITGNSSLTPNRKSSASTVTRLEDFGCMSGRICGRKSWNTDRDCRLSNKSWESLVRDADESDMFPLTFITPFIEEKENF